MVIKLEMHKRGAAERFLSKDTMKRGRAGHGVKDVCSPIGNI